LSASAARIEPRATIHPDSVAGNIDRQLGGVRVVSVLAGILGLIALVLAAVGVFGVFAYVVQQRTREIGLRIALGASSARVAGLLVGDSSWALLAGLASGLVMSIGASRVISSELYGASGFELRVFAGVAVLLTAAGAAATVVPARRASR